LAAIAISLAFGEGKTIWLLGTWRSEFDWLWFRLLVATPACGGQRCMQAYGGVYILWRFFGLWTRQWNSTNPTWDIVEGLRWPLLGILPSYVSASALVTCSIKLVIARLGWWKDERLIKWAQRFPSLFSV